MIPCKECVVFLLMLWRLALLSLVFTTLTMICLGVGLFMLIPFMLIYAYSSGHVLYIHFCLLSNWGKFFVIFIELFSLFFWDSYYTYVGILDIYIKCSVVFSQSFFFHSSCWKIAIVLWVHLFCHLHPAAKTAQ